jgi:hypothetical protein
MQETNEGATMSIINSVAIHDFNRGGMIKGLFPHDSRKEADNPIDSYDQGRGIQTSVYGSPDGSLWNNQPWVLNSIMGGDWRKQGNQGYKLNGGAYCFGRHWATGQPTNLNHYLEHGGVGRNSLRLQIVQRGLYRPIEVVAPVRDQEVPAIFCKRQYDRLFVNGTQVELKPLGIDGVPGRIDLPKPGPSKVNEIFLVKADGYGIRLAISDPRVVGLAHYSFLNKGQKSACTYIAPLAQFAYGGTFAAEMNLGLAWKL